MIFSKLSENKQQEIINFIIDRFSAINEDDLYLKSDSDGDFLDGDHFYDLSDSIGATWCDYGATKVVFYFREFPDWVFKVPIYGNYYVYEEEYCDYQYANQNVPIHSTNDYCATETYLSHYAQDCGFGNSFLLTEYLETVNCVPIYISEYLETIFSFTDCSKYYSNESYNNSLKLAERYELENSRLWQEVIAIFVEQLGIQGAENLLTFIEDNSVSDLHTGNMAFDKNGQLVIIDCAGYYDN